MQNLLPGAEKRRVKTISDVVAMTANDSSK
jgi:hypothetical protein